MQSKITGGETSYLFTLKVLNKYDVKYYRCNETGFVQTEEPYWLEEAYSSAITKLDIGLPSRNIFLSAIIDKLIFKYFKYDSVFLDYAGGYGLFTRLMRDKGYNFYHTDKFCKNLFAENFDLTDLPQNTGFELVTTFEVLEHLANPIEEVKEMLNLSTTLVFTTELQPQDKDIKDWHYLSTETGQHIAFYTIKALTYMANRLGYNFYSDGSFVHMFTKHKFETNPFEKPEREPFLLRKARKYVARNDAKKQSNLQSLLGADHQKIRDIINANHR